MILDTKLSSLLGQPSTESKKNSKDASVKPRLHGAQAKLLTTWHTNVSDASSRSNSEVRTVIDEGAIDYQSGVPAAETDVSEQQLALNKNSKNLEPENTTPFKDLFNNSKKKTLPDLNKASTGAQQPRESKSSDSGETSKATTKQASSEAKAEPNAELYTAASKGAAEHAPPPRNQLKSSVREQVTQGKTESKADSETDSRTESIAIDSNQDSNRSSDRARVPTQPRAGAGAAPGNDAQLRGTDGGAETSLPQSEGRTEATFGGKAEAKTNTEPNAELYTAASKGAAEHAPLPRNQLKSSVREQVTQGKTESKTDGETDSKTESGAIDSNQDSNQSSDTARLPTQPRAGAGGAAGARDDAQLHGTDRALPQAESRTAATVGEKAEAKAEPNPELYAAATKGAAEHAPLPRNQLKSSVREQVTQSKTEGKTESKVDSETDSRTESGAIDSNQDSNQSSDTARVPTQPRAGAGGAAGARDDAQLHGTDRALPQAEGRISATFGEKAEAKAEPNPELYAAATKGAAEHVPVPRNQLKSSVREQVTQGKTESKTDSETDSRTESIAIDSNQDSNRSSDTARVPTQPRAGAGAGAGAGNDAQLHGTDRALPQAESQTAATVGEKAEAKAEPNPELYAAATKGAAEHVPPPRNQLKSSVREQVTLGKTESKTDSEADGKTINSNQDSNQSSDIAKVPTQQHVGAGSSSFSQKDAIIPTDGALSKVTEVVSTDSEPANSTLNQADKSLEDDATKVSPEAIVMAGIGGNLIQNTGFSTVGLSDQAIDTSTTIYTSLPSLTDNPVDLSNDTETNVSGSASTVFGSGLHDIPPTQGVAAVLNNPLITSVAAGYEEVVAMLSPMSPSVANIKSHKISTSYSLLDTHEPSDTEDSNQSDVAEHKLVHMIVSDTAATSDKNNTSHDDALPMQQQLLSQQLASFSAEKFTSLLNPEQQTLLNQFNVLLGNLSPQSNPMSASFGAMTSNSGQTDFQNGMPIRFEIQMPYIGAFEMSVNTATFQVQVDFYVRDMLQRGRLQQLLSSARAARVGGSKKSGSLLDEAVDVDDSSDRADGGFQSNSDTRINIKGVAI